MFRFLTAGESHGEAIIAILEGLPEGVRIDYDFINSELSRRQSGYGRSERMKLEKDEVKIISGVRKNLTTGAPISLIIMNKDYREKLPEMTKPRAGHADLAGLMKFLKHDFSDISERASARETAARVAAGAICKLFLKEFGIHFYSYVDQIHNVALPDEEFDIEKVYHLIETSPVRCPDKKLEKLMMQAVDKAEKARDSVGGTFRVIIRGCPPGLGSHAQWDMRLDAKLAKAILSIQGVKGVEFGLGFKYPQYFGSQVHDRILYKGKFVRTSNNAGGIEGGISNGEDIVIRAVMKPIPTLRKGLKTVDVKSKKLTISETPRADICAVPSCAVIAESMAAITIAETFLDKFGGDSMKETRNNFNGYIKMLRRL